MIFHNLINVLELIEYRLEKNHTLQQRDISWRVNFSKRFSYIQLINTETILPSVDDRIEELIFARYSSPTIIFYGRTFHLLQSSVVRKRFGYRFNEPVKRVGNRYFGSLSSTRTISEFTVASIIPPVHGM